MIKRDVGIGYYEGVLLFVGGDCNATPIPFKDTLTYTVALDVWSTKTETPVSRQDVYQNVKIAGGVAFVIGSLNGALSKVLNSYTMATDTWTTLTPCPNIRYRTTSVLLSDGMFLTFGDDTSAVKVIVNAYNTGILPTTPAGGSSDPHMRDFFGHRFLLNCPPGVYNLFSSKDLQINAILDLPPGAPIGWTIVMTHIAVKILSTAGELSFLINSQGNLHTNCRASSSQTVDGVHHFVFGDVLVTAGVGVRVFSHRYSLQVFPQHITLANGNIFDYCDFLIHPTWSVPGDFHGIIGQTARLGHVRWPSTSKHIEHQHPFEYLEGSVEDYEIPDGNVFGDPIVYNRYSLYLCDHP